MPNEFQAGDRVRCVMGGGGAGGVVQGQIYTVGGYVDGLVSITELRQGLFFSHRFVLDAEVAPTNQSAVTFYTLVYKTRFASRRMMGFETEEEFNDKKRTVLANGGTVFAEKKLKLTNVGAQ